MNVALQRLYNQQLLRSRFRQPHELLAWMGAVQGQDYAGVKWALGLRLPGSNEASLEQAIAQKAILRTWALRGTLHFVAAADIRWLLALVAPRLIAGNARRYRELELDEPTLARSNDLLAKALQDGQQLNRTALRAILEQNGISPRGQRAVYMLQRASLDGLICQGLAPRNNPVFMALDDSIPPGKSMSRDESLVELAKRYFASHGPASLPDFAWWSGLPAAEARAGLQAIQSDLTRETIDGQEYWFSPSQPPVLEKSPTVYLLPPFDEYLISYRDRSASLDPQHASLVNLGSTFSSTFVIAGRVTGAWKRAFRKGAVVIACQPFVPLTSGQESAFQAAARRYGEFLGMPVELA